MYNRSGMLHMDEKEFKSTLWVALKSSTLQSKVAQNEIAKSIGLLRTSIASIEPGSQNPTSFQIHMTCMRFGVSPLKIIPSFLYFKKFIKQARQKRDSVSVIRAMLFVGIGYSKHKNDALIKSF